MFGVNMLDVYTGTAVDASDATVEDGSDPEEGRGETIYSTRDSLRAQSLRSAHGGYQVQEIQPQENCEYWNHIPPSPPHTYTHTHHCHTPIISNSLCIVSRQLECYPLFQTEINISPKLRKDAHDIILDFIRSRPTLKPVTVT